MYGLAYVLVPADFSSLQEALDRSLAPFKRGGPEDFPPEALQFEDCGPWLQTLWQAELTVTRKDGGLSLRGNSDAWLLTDADALGRWLAETGQAHWQGRLREVEPDFDRFVQRFTTAPFDAQTGQYGSWYNPLGHWDWWELGGRFDGAATGEPRPARDSGRITSGASRGRDMLGRVVQTLTDAIGGAVTDDQAEIEANVELASTVLTRLRDDPEAVWPTTVVRPIGAAPDVARWIESAFLRAPPIETHLSLGLDPDAVHRDAVLAALEAHSDHIVGGVAYHL